MIIKKDYKKYTSPLDKFPFIILYFILILAVIIVLELKAEYPLSFFSGQIASIQESSNEPYPILVVSPANNEVFNFVSENDYIPVEIKSRQIEGLNYNLNLVINDKDIIKTFSSPPYRYDWRLPEPGTYTLVANLVDNSNKTISSSNKVKFEVNLNYEKEKTIAPVLISTNIPSTTVKTAESRETTIKLEIYEGPTYSAGNDICFYRVKVTVTGNPVPSVSFSKDDCGGAWGPLKTQINLTRNSPNYVLTAIATNSVSQAMDSITLNWGCGPLEENQ